MAEWFAVEGSKLGWNVYTPNLRLHAIFFAVCKRTSQWQDWPTSAIYCGLRWVCKNNSTLLPKPQNMNIITTKTERLNCAIVNIICCLWFGERGTRICKPNEFANPTQSTVAVTSLLILHTSCISLCTIPMAIVYNKKLVQLLSNHCSRSLHKLTGGFTQVLASFPGCLPLQFSWPHTWPLKCLEKQLLCHLTGLGFSNYGNVLMHV